MAAVHVGGGMLEVVGYRDGTLEMVLWEGLPNEFLLVSEFLHRRNWNDKLG